MPDEDKDNADAAIAQAESLGVGSLLVSKRFGAAAGGKGSAAFGGDVGGQHHGLGLGLGLGGSAASGLLSSNSSSSSGGAANAGLTEAQLLALLERSFSYITTEVRCDQSDICLIIT